MLRLAGRPRLALAATQLLCEGSAFLRNLILARLIGAEQMGLAVALALGIRVLEMAGDFGVDRLLVQVEASSLPALRRAVHLLQLAKGCALAVVAVLLAAPLAQALEPALDPVLFAVAALSFAVRGAANCDYRERQRRQEFVPALVVEGLSTLVAALAIAPLAWLARDYSALAWASLLQAALFCGLSHRVATRRFTLGIERAALRRCLRYGLPIALNGALMFLAMQGDRVIVALYFPAEALARFAIAAQLTLLPALIGARCVMASALPRIAPLVDDPAALGRYEAGLLVRAAAASTAGVLLFGVAGNAIVGVLYGAAYAVSPELFWLLALAAGLRLVRAVPGTSLLAFERTQLLFVSNLPRLLTLALACVVAAAGADLAAVALIAAAGEAASLVIALLASSAARAGVQALRSPQLAEGT